MEASTCELFRSCLGRQSPDAWREFVKRCDGDLRRAIRQALARHGPRRPQLNPENELEDLLQELYCRLWSHGIPSFRGHSDREMWGYLRVTVRNLVVDHRRATHAEKRWLRVFRDGRCRDRAHQRPVVEARLGWQDVRRRLLQHSREIVSGRRSRVQLKALHLTIFEGWSSRETSSLLRHAVTPMQVNALVLRLKRLLEQEGISMPRRGAKAVAVPALRERWLRRPTDGRIA